MKKIMKKAEDRMRHSFRLMWARSEMPHMVIYTVRRKISAIKNQLARSYKKYSPEFTFTSQSLTEDNMTDEYSHFIRSIDDVMLPRVAFLELTDELLQSRCDPDSVIGWAMHSAVIYFVPPRKSLSSAARIFIKRIELGFEDAGETLHHIYNDAGEKEFDGGYYERENLPLMAARMMKHTYSIRKAEKDLERQDKSPTISKDRAHELIDLLFEIEPEEEMQAKDESNTVVVIGLFTSEKKNIADTIRKHSGERYIDALRGLNNLPYRIFCESADEASKLESLLNSKGANCYVL